MQFIVHKIDASRKTAVPKFKIVLYDWDDNVVRQTMLGLIVKQNATKEDYEIRTLIPFHADRLGNTL